MTSEAVPLITEAIGELADQVDSNRWETERALPQTRDRIVELVHSVTTDEVVATVYDLIVYSLEAHRNHLYHHDPPAIPPTRADAVAALAAMHQDQALGYELRRPW